jgi:hypothetical protein
MHAAAPLLRQQVASAKTSGVSVASARANTFVHKPASNPSKSCCGRAPPGNGARLRRKPEAPGADGTRQNGGWPALVTRLVQCRLPPAPAGRCRRSCWRCCCCHGLPCRLPRLRHRLPRWRKKVCCGEHKEPPLASCRLSASRRCPREQLAVPRRSHRSALLCAPQPCHGCTSPPLDPAAAGLMQQMRELVRAAGSRMTHMAEGWAPADPAPHCRWAQVTCDDDGRVARL